MKSGHVLIAICDSPDSPIVSTAREIAFLSFVTVQYTQVERTSCSRPTKRGLNNL